MGDYQFFTVYTKAIDWLANEDTWRPAADVRDEVFERLMVERYAIEVLVVSVGGRDWAADTSLVGKGLVSLSELPTCDCQVQYC